MKRENTVKFMPWSPFPGVPPRLFVDRLDYDGNQLSICLNDEQGETILELIFDSPIAFQLTDEGDRLRTLAAHESWGTSTLYTIENSEWMQWFCQENDNAYADRRLLHFGIYTDNECIDILDIEQPKIIRS